MKMFWKHSCFWKARLDNEPEAVGKGKLKVAISSPLQMGFLESPRQQEAFDPPPEYIFLNGTQERPFQWKKWILTFRGGGTCRCVSLGVNGVALVHQWKVGLGAWASPQPSSSGSRSPRWRCSAWCGRGGEHQSSSWKKVSCELAFVTSEKEGFCSEAQGQEMWACLTPLITVLQHLWPHYHTTVQKSFCHVFVTSVY